MENRDAELLIKVLDDEELEIVKDAYNLTKIIEDQRLKTLLQRRIKDIVSMARFIDMCADIYYQNALEHLFDRIRNLRITVRNIKEPSKTKSTFNYLADNTETPFIMRSLESIGYDQHEEVADLLSSLAQGNIHEETIDDSLKRITGRVVSIIFVRKEESILIYDIDGPYTKKVSEESIPAIKSKCEKFFLEKGPSIIQNIFDDMVCETVNYIRPSQETGYGLKKES